MNSGAGRESGAGMQPAVADGRPVEAFFDELRGPLFRYLLCAGLGREDAEETAQECFLRLQQHVAAGGHRSNLRGWIFQVARNLAWNQLKRARRIQTGSLDGEAHVDPRGTPEDRVMRQERARHLRASLQKLTAQQRECLLLRASGLRYREIGEVMGIGISAVGELVQRATTRLAEELS